MSDACPLDDERPDLLDGNDGAAASLEPGLGRPWLAVSLTGETVTAYTHLMVASLLSLT